MGVVQLFGYYFLWHYGQAYADLWTVSRNILWFLFNFFSFTLLLKTFFSPFQKLHENFQGGLDVENILSVILVNTIMRVVGAVMRSIVLSIGIIVLLFTALAELLLFSVWAALPFLIPGLLLLGISYL